MLKNLIRIGIPVLVVLASIGIAGYLKATRPTVSPEEPKERVWTVAAETAAVGDIRPKMKLFGEIVSGRTVDLRPQVSGRVVRASPNLVEGGVVRAGEVLVNIDRFNYEAAVRESEAQIAEAKGRLKELETQLAGARSLLDEDIAQVDLRRKDTERRAKLRGSGAGSVKSSDDARLALSEARQRRIDREKEIRRLEAAIEQQKAAIDRLGVELSRAKRDLEETRITAPFDGFIFSVEIAEGKWINVGDPIARLIDANRLEVKFYAGRAQFRRLVAGGGYKQRSARVMWRGREGSEPYNAYIERLGSEVDATTGGVDLYARIEAGGADTLLRPGAFVEVHVPDRLFQNVVRLPAVAVQDDGTVYVVEDGRLAIRKVEVRTRIDGDVLVAGALRNGDRVVTTRFPEIASGVKVRVQ